MALISNPGLRPFCQQTDIRCAANVLLTVLAYHLQRWVETRLDAAITSHSSMSNVGSRPTATPR